jgi:16S rRNA (guanine(1405)-N(7))-methyltransferase
MDYDAVIASLVDARNSGSGEAFREVVTCILHQHASTKERLPILGEFYSRIWDRIGPPKRILDLACGLAPVAFPWMGLDSDVCYHGYDIDCERIRFLNRFFELVDLRPLATVQDVIAETPKESADAAFLLKAVPSFERDEKGSSIRILRELNVENIVVSFPVKSLGGRSKGMEENYASLMREMVAGERWRVEEIPFETEQVFVLRKGG